MCLSPSWRTLNALGTIFGGSLYAACCPWFVMILLRKLAPGYIVWDRAASIQFKKPGRGTVSRCFSIAPTEVEEIRRPLEVERAVERTYRSELVGSDGTVVASVEKVLYVRKGDRKQQTANPMPRLIQRIVMAV